MDIRFGQDDDFGWLLHHDHRVALDWIRRCLCHREYILATDEAATLGFLRFSMFWGTIPYMDLIWVAESLRQQGVGTGLLQFWEQEMRRSGAKLLMTSSMQDEPAPQAWHRRNGFLQSGSLAFGTVQQTPEIFFVRELV